MIVSASFFMRVIVSVLLGVFIFPTFVLAGPDAIDQYLLRANDDPWVTMARTVRGLPGGRVDLDGGSVFNLSKTILALVAEGRDPRSTTSGDLVHDFLFTYVHDGQIGNLEYVNDDFWGIMALRSAGVPASDPALRDARAFVLKAQKVDGGWSWSATYAPADTDDTAAAVMALTATGMSANDPVLVRAREYLRKSQNQDGGFPNVPPGASSIESTAWVVSALWKSGENPNTWTRGDKDAIAYLRSQEKSDGSFGDAESTAYAVIALEGKSYPVRSYVPPVVLPVQQEPPRSVEIPRITLPSASPPKPVVKRATRVEKKVTTRVQKSIRALKLRKKK